MRRIALVVLPFAAYLSIASAQADAVDAFVRAQLKSQNIPGLSLAVVQRGRIVKAEGYGVADRQAKTPARPDTVYKIASVSKQFIAAGIMLLVQDGRISVDDPVVKHLDGAPESWAPITIRHLLTHTSGLVREAPAFDAKKVRSDAELIRSAYRTPLRFAPGEKWEYANLPYFILAEIIRRVSGQPWTEFLAARIFEPLGMNATYPTNTTAKIPNLARGYVDNDRLLNAPEWVALRPSGAFLSTVLDLAKWDAALYTNDPLAEATRRQMWTPVTLNDGRTHGYGYGWYVQTRDGRKVIHHGGGMPGTRAAFVRYLDDELSVIVLMNLDDVDWGAIAFGVAKLYLPATSSSVARVERR